jgi:hypothetical protein
MTDLIALIRRAPVEMASIALGLAVYCGGGVWVFATEVIGWNR